MSEEHESELLMPFVTVVSVGGPHDDESYVCGFEVGEISAILESRTIAATLRVVHTSNVSQLDLVAMRHGYRLDVIDGHGIDVEGWTHVGLTREDTPIWAV